MKIIDCFTFYNELHLLSYRLAILDDIVDYFVIVEATHTHAGYEKELYFEKNKELFSKYHDKIIHIVVEDFEYKQPTIDFSKNQQWLNENFQRNCISRGIDKLTLNDEDIFMISDLDEIPDPQTLRKIKNNEIEISIHALQQDFYYYNLNTLSDIKWTGCKCIRYKSYIDLNISCEKIRHYKCPIIKNGGWHLSYFGDPSFIANKIKNFAHQEFNNSDITNLKNIEEKMSKTLDVYNRPYSKWIHIKIEDNNYLPPKYTELLEGFYKYKIAKHITFFYNEERHKNVEYINKIIDEDNSYGHSIDLFIHTNTSLDITKFLHENKFGITKQITHDLSNQNPWILPWKCRDLLKSQKDDYDIFIYSEDDILIKKESFEYWLTHKDNVMKYNYNLGFLLLEVTDQSIEVCTNLAINKKNCKENGYLETIIDLDGKEYALNNKNPYCALWIYDKKEFNKFVNSNYYNPANIRGYGIAESAAIGLHGLETSWYKGTLIPIVKDTILESGSKLYHIPNKYWNLVGSHWDLIPFIDVIKR